MSTPISFWKPSEGSSQQTGSESNAIENARHVHSSFAVAPHRRQILYSVEHCGVVVVVGATGSGKSTQIPRYLVQAGWTDQGFSVACTQPRRSSALALQRSNDAINDMDRDSVGTIQYVTDEALLQQIMIDPLLSLYSVVMVDDVHERTVPTDALLGVLRKIRQQRRPDLRLIIASATTASATAVLEFLIAKAPTLSPSMDDLVLLPLHQRGTIISVGGKPNPVEVHYLESPTPDYVVTAVETVWSVYKHHVRDNGDRSDGDILCFLPTLDDIQRAVRLAEEFFDQQEGSTSMVDFLPFHETLSQYVQSQVLHVETPPVRGKGRRKSESRRTRVVFADHSAEASVTVPHVRYVVDSGLVRLSYFDTDTGLDRFFTGPISQETAHQRTSLVGRPSLGGPGTCYRLYTEAYLGLMAAKAPIAVHRTNLTSLLLTLKAVGVDNILGFELIDTPSIKAIQFGLESLYALSAIDDRTRLTKMGLNMTSFPVDPRISRMLLQSLNEGCSWEALTVASAMHVNQDLLNRPRGHGKSSSVRQQQLLDYEEAMATIIDSTGDHVTLVNLFSAADDHGWNASECKERFVNYNALKQGLELRRHLSRLLTKFGKVNAFGGSATGGDLERSQAIRRCVTAGFFASTAKLGSDGTYYTMRKRIQVSPSPVSVFATHSHISSEYIVFGESVDGPRDTIEVRFVSAVEAIWLRDLAPHYWG